MADTIDLLGLVGTWLAAILALVALAGIIPAYILYRESQTGHYEALSLIDDQSHEYISKGYTLLPGKQFLRSVKVPNLIAPPRITAEDPPSQQLRIERECDLLDREGSPSLTAWVNFANVLRAYGICPPPPFTGKIKISGKESLLPVHRGWILLLGLVDRYGHRYDYGLFEGESSEPEWSELGWEALYGLSGILEAIRPMRNRITFRMHSISHMVKMPSNMPAEDVSLRNLFFLFLGYIPAADGSLLCTALESDEMSNSRKTRLVPRSTDTRTNFFYKLRILEHNEIPLRHRRMASEIGIRLPRIRQASVHKIHRVERSRTNLGYSSEEHGELDGVQYQRIDRTATNIKVWVDPSDSKAMVLSLLQLNMSAHSFLCDDDLAEFFARLLPARNNDYLQHLADEGDFILQIKQEEKKSLKIAISEVLKYETSSTRSRGRASALAALEAVVKRLEEAYQIPTWSMQTMAILYFISRDFASRLLCKSSHVDPQAMFVIDASGKTVHVPALSIYPEAQFAFDFDAVFKVPIGEQGPTDLRLPLWQVMLAALYGDIKWQMWSTVFSAWDFSRFYADLDRIVYIPGQSSLDDQDKDTLGGHMRDVASACQEITGLLRELRAGQARSKRIRRSRRPRHLIDEEEVESGSESSEEESSGGKESDSCSETSSSSALSMGEKSESRTSQRSQDLDDERSNVYQRQERPLNYDPIHIEDVHPRPQTTASRTDSFDHSTMAIDDLQYPNQKSAVSLLSPPPALTEGQQKIYVLSFQDLHPTLGADPERATETRDHGEIDKHNLIATKCLELLSGPGILVQNACHLASPGSARTDIDSHDVAVALPPHVQYACRYWVYHLGHGKCPLKDEDQVTVFLKCHLLHWLEALALMGCIYESIAMMKTLLSLVDPSSLYVSPLLADVLHFVQRTASIVDTAPLQLYSAIIWLPESSLTRRIYLHQVSGSLPQIPIVDARWSAVHKTLGETGGTQSSQGTSLAFSSDGKLLASGYKSGAVKVWDTTTGQLLRTMLGGHDDRIEAVAFSPDSRFLASATYGGNLHGGLVQVHESKTGTKLYDLKFSTDNISYPRAVAFYGDGTVLAVGGGNGIITLWDLNSGSLIRSLDGHTEAATALGFSVDGLLASGSNDRTARLWNPESGQLLRTFEGFSAPVWMVGFAADGDLRMGSTDGVVQRWNMWDGGAIQTLTTPTRDLDLSKISRVVLSSSGKLLVVPVDRDVELHDALSGERTHVVRGGMGEVAVALSPDDTLMAVASEDQSGIEIRELCRESEIDSTIDFTSDSIDTLYQPDGLMEFSPDGRLLVSTGHGRLCLWDTATGGSIHSLTAPFVAKVLFSPDSRWLTFAAGPASYKWDIHRGLGGIHPIPSHSAGSLHFSISPDSKVLAQEISAIGHVQLWSIETMESLHSFRVLHAVGDMAFSPDNKCFACGLLSGHIQRWDIDTETPLQTLSDHTSPITNVAFSSDSKLLASASTDKKITIWDWATGSALRTLSADTGVVAQLSFCNEDTFLQTDQGVFLPVNDTSASSSASAASPPPKAQPRFGLSPDGSWITRNGENFLWLMDYKADALSRYESRLALTLKTGRVVLIGFRDLDSW
ncbi:hypothetical protein BJX62DRAFT_239534 [Aspergillus germanicus]